MENTNKLGFFDQVIYSVQPKKYKYLLEQPKRRVIGYLLILMMCFTIMNTVIPVAGWFISVGGYDNLIENVLPDMELKDGKFTSSGKLEMGEGSLSYILVDTSVKRFEAKDLETDKYTGIILVSQENMIVYSTNSDAMELKFSDLSGYTVTNNDLLSLKTLVYISVGVSVIVSMLIQLVQYLLYTALLAFVCWGPFTIRGTKRMKYGDLFKLALYPRTAGMLFLAFNSSAGLISDTAILSYIEPIVGVFILMAALRKLGGEEKNE